MAGKNETIEKILNTKLKTFASEKSRVCILPGKMYDPVPGTAFIQADFLPAEPQTASIGLTEPERMAGIYQLKIYTDGISAQAVGYDIEEEIGEYFQKGVPIELDGKAVQIDRVYAQKFDTDGAFTVKVISISYRIYL